MKPKYHFSCRLAAFCIAVAATAHVQAQTWTSTEVILPGPDPVSAPLGIGRSVMIDPFKSSPAHGVLLGIQAGSAGAASIVRLTPIGSSSSAFTPENVDDALTSVGGLAHSPADGVLYAVGYAPIDPTARNITYNWKVRKSANHGNAGTWSDDDTFALARNAYSAARKVTLDPYGKVFVAGVAVDGKGAAPHWIVRRKVLGAVWSTVFDAKGNNINMLPSVCYFPGNANNPTPAVFATSDLNSKWTVLRSQLTNPSKPDSLGALGTWFQVDSWTGGGTEASAYDITCDPSNGYLYVVGCRGLNGKNPSAWVIRTSTNGGNTWSTLLDVAGAGSWASMAAVDANGRVCVSGVVNPAQESSSGTLPLWKIIRCSDPQNPASWISSFTSPDTIPFGAKTYSKGGGIAIDPVGNAFVAGTLDNWTDTTTSLTTTYSGTRVGLLRMVP